jgi:hypothetical protein
MTDGVPNSTVGGRNGDDDSSYISELKVWLEFFDDDLKLGV